MVLDVFLEVLKFFFSEEAEVESDNFEPENDIQSINNTSENDVDSEEMQNDDNGHECVEIENQSKIVIENEYYTFVGDSSENRFENEETNSDESRELEEYEWF